MSADTPDGYEDSEDSTEDPQQSVALATVKKTGRPTKYSSEYPEKAQKLFEQGCTDREVAEFFGVHETTLRNWSADHPEFFLALKMGKAAADDRVEQSLYRRALGYSHDSVHISNYQGQVTITPIVEHYAPDTTAAIFWLKNRRPQQWRDVKAVDHSGAITHKHVSDRASIIEELAHIHARLVEARDGRGAEPDSGALPESAATH